MPSQSSPSASAGSHRTKAKSALDSVNFLVNVREARKLLAHGVDYHCRQSLGEPSYCRGCVTPDHRSALGHHFPILRQQSAQAIDLRSPELDKLGSHSVQRQYRLLSLALDRHCPEAWLLHGSPDRSRVSPIILISGDEGFDRTSGQELDLVPQFLELARPMLGSATGFHANYTACAIGKMFEELVALQLHAEDFTALVIYPVHLKDSLGDIDSDYRRFHLALR